MMPLYTGGSLRQRSLSMSELRDAMRQMLGGLRHLHEQGQIHRDLKPENVLVRSGKNEPVDIVVADFGLISLDNPVSFVGSPGYAAPEVVLNRNKAKCDCTLYSESVDVYALGMLLLEVLGVQLPMMWLSSRKDSNNFISAPIADHIDNCDPRDVERCGALSTADTMLRFDPRDRPSVDECLRLEWFTSPQVPQTTNTSSILSISKPLSSRPLAEPAKTWWHSDPRPIGAPCQPRQSKVRQNREKRDPYNLRSGKQTKRHGSISKSKKNKVQKKPSKSLPPLPTPVSTPDRDEKHQKPKSLPIFKATKSEDSTDIPGRNPTETDHKESQPLNDLPSWDKMEISE